MFYIMQHSPAPSQTNTRVSEYLYLMTTYRYKITEVYQIISQNCLFITSPGVLLSPELVSSTIRVLIPIQMILVRYLRQTPNINLLNQHNSTICSQYGKNAVKLIPKLVSSCIVIAITDCDNNNVGHMIVLQAQPI